MPKLALLSVAFECHVQSYKTFGILYIIWKKLYMSCLEKKKIEFRSELKEWGCCSKNVRFVARARKKRFNILNFSKNSVICSKKKKKLNLKSCVQNISCYIIHLYLYIITHIQIYTIIIYSTEQHAYTYILYILWTFIRV